MVLACVLSLMGALHAVPPPEAAPSPVSVAVSSEQQPRAVPPGRWPISSAVKMFAVVALATLAFSGALGATAVSLLVGARAGALRSRSWLGTDILLGMAAFTGLVAVLGLLLASGSSVVCALWWLAEVSTQGD
jgi:hypothetical protein